MMVGVLLIVKIVLHVDKKYRRENIKMSRRMKLEHRHASASSSASSSASRRSAAAPCSASS